MGELEKLVDEITKDLEPRTTFEEMVFEGVFLKWCYDYPINYIVDILYEKYLPILKRDGLVIKNG